MTEDTHQEATIDQPYSATEQHIRLLQAKRDRIIVALAEAERQYAAAVGREFRAGSIGWAELLRTYQVIRDGKIPGFVDRWEESVPHTPQAMRLNAQRDPNGQQQWSGYGMDVGRDPNRPPKGVCVVYILFGSEGEVVYVGSTESFASRMSQHRRDKTWSSWQAHRCRDRKHAYQVEARFLQQYMPERNRRGPAVAS